MQKKKVKIIFEMGKLIARTWIVNIPAVFILLVLMMLDKLSWVSALVALLCFWGLSSIIVFFIFKDLDEFISYLNKISEGVSEELPKFDKSLFSSRRLANAFQAVSSLWQNQALTDTSILENLPDPLIMINKDNKIVFINKAGKKLLTAKELNQNIFDVFKISINTKKNTLFFKWQKKQNHQTFYFQGRMDTLSFPTRLGATRTFVLHDITSFEEFYRQQVDFFANASHELKTPLAIISGAIETLQGPAQKDTKAQKTFLNMILTQTNHMTTLVQDFLNLAHLQQINKKEDLTQIQVGPFLSDLIKSFLPKAVAKHQKIILDAKNEPIYFKSTTADFKYMCQNLLDNAIKYAPESAQIKISLNKTNKNFSIEFYNSGSYIPPQYQRVIFERFYRLNTPNKKTQEGSGLGLNIVLYLSQKYHGKISLKSSPTKGTSFFLTLPLST